MPIPTQNKKCHQGDAIQPCHHRFFKKVPNNDAVSKKWHAFTCARQSLSYYQQWLQEVSYGVVSAVCAYPFNIVSATIENSFYAKKTAIIHHEKHLFDDRQIRMYIRFQAPIVEELVFRGLMLHGLHQTLNKTTNLSDMQIAVASSLVNSTVFSAMHHRGMRIPSFFGGLVMSGLTYLFDGSLVPALACHTTNNNVAMTIHMASKRFRHQ